MSSGTAPSTSRSPAAHTPSTRPASGFGFPHYLPPPSILITAWMRRGYRARGCIRSAAFAAGSSRPRRIAAPREVMAPIGTRRAPRCNPSGPERVPKACSSLPSCKDGDDLVVGRRETRASRVRGVRHQRPAPHGAAHLLSSGDVRCRLGHWWKIIGSRRAPHWWPCNRRDPPDVSLSVRPSARVSAPRPRAHDLAPRLPAPPPAAQGGNGERGDAHEAQQVADPPRRVR
jgi:hypothetical protein